MTAPNIRSSAKPAITLRGGPAAQRDARGEQGRMADAAAYMGIRSSAARAAGRARRAGPVPVGAAAEGHRQP
jgi:hypothetical protein